MPVQLVASALVSGHFVSLQMVLMFGKADLPPAAAFKQARDQSDAAALWGFIILATVYASGRGGLVPSHTLRDGAECVSFGAELRLSQS
jgi:hypothetical protein